MFLGFLAYICLCISTLSCSFMKIDGYLSDEAPYVKRVSSELFTSTIGIFSYQEFAEFGTSGSSSACIPYNKTQMKNYEYLDGAVKAAQAFAVLANICLLVGTIALVILSCIQAANILRNAVAIVFLVGSMFEVLIFVMYASSITDDDSPHHARFYWGTLTNAFGVVLSLRTGILCFKLPEYDPESSEGEKNDKTTNNKTDDKLEKGNNEEQAEQPKSPVSKKTKKARMPAGSETTTETILPDGSRKYTTTKWNKDGTTTVTENIVQ
jgi:hypothetical protein